MTDPFPGCGSQNGLTGSITPLTGPGKPRARAANGVQGVTLSVNTVAGGTVVNGTTLSGPTVGAGSVGTIDLPAASVLSVNARGDLGNVLGPSSSSSLTGATAIDLYFANLTGSITGLDHVHALSASGWLGQSVSQQVAVARGIDAVMAYGVGATVHADEQQNAGDAPATFTIGDGGVTGAIDAGNVGSFSTRGAVNALKVKILQGLLTMANTNLVFFQGGKPAANAKVGNAGIVGFAGGIGFNFQSIDGAAIGNLVVAGALNVLQDFKAQTIGNLSADSLTVGGEMSITKFIVGPNPFSIGSLTVAGNMKAQRGLTARNSIGTITVGGNLDTALSATASLGSITGGTPGRGGDFTGSVEGWKDVGPVQVVGSFKAPAGVANPIL